MVDIIQGTASAHKVIWKSDISEYDKLKILVSAVVEKLCETFKGFSSLKEQNRTNET